MVWGFTPASLKLTIFYYVTPYTLVELGPSCSFHLHTFNLQAIGFTIIFVNFCRTARRSRSRILCNFRLLLCSYEDGVSVVRCRPIVWQVIVQSGVALTRQVVINQVSVVSQISEPTDTAMLKVPLNDRQNGRRRLGRPVKRLLDKAEKVCHGSNSWQMMIRTKCT